MARAGITKSEVRKARDVLISRGTYPSSDAVLAITGGSKSTIHKYLKQLEIEEGGVPAISTALQELVARLSEQLHAEANEQVAQLSADYTSKEQQQAIALSAVRQELEQVRGQFQRIEMALQQERDAHVATREALQQETILRHTAEQHAKDLQDQLAEKEAHSQSIEEKHQHTRDALEHYRQSVKEQRETDIRRHEQQIQQMQAELRQSQQTIIVKHEELTRLNQEGAILVMELSYTKQNLYEQRTLNSKLEQKIEMLQPLQQHAANLEQQLASKNAEVGQLNNQLSAASSQIRELELLHAQAHAKAQTQEQIGDHLRAYFDKIGVLTEMGPVT